MHRWLALPALVALSACPGDVPVATVGEPSDSTSSASSGDDPSASSTPPPTTTQPTSTSEPVTSGEPGTTNGETAHLSDTEPPGTASTGSESTTTTADTGTDETGASTGAPDFCGPPCDELWIHEGDLVLTAPFNTDNLVCMGMVAGEVHISGDADPASLAGLANLWYAPQINIESNDVLTDLAPLACLRDVGYVSLFNTPALIDADLPELQLVSGVSFTGTGLTAAPTFAPGVTVGNVMFRNNPALVDLTAMDAWDGGEDVFIEVSASPALTDLAGLAGPLMTAENPADLQLIDLPQLPSLAGLETVDGLQHLWLQDLPQVADLEPLALLIGLNSLTLFDIPGVTTLHGLHNLENVGLLTIGDCVNEQPNTPGMNGLVDLTGLDSLTFINGLFLANNANLSSLAGAPSLTQVDGLTAIANPKLTPAALDAFADQLQQPPSGCVGTWDQCTCFQINPW